MGQATCQNALPTLLYKQRRVYIVSVCRGTSAANVQGWAGEDGRVFDYRKGLSVGSPNEKAACQGRDCKCEAWQNWRVMTVMPWDFHVPNVDFRNVEELRKPDKQIIKYRNGTACMQVCHTIVSLTSNNHPNQPPHLLGQILSCPPPPPSTFSHLVLISSLVVSRNGNIYRHSGFAHCYITQKTARPTELHSVGSNIHSTQWPLYASQKYRTISVSLGQRKILPPVTLNGVHMCPPFCNQASGCSPNRPKKPVSQPIISAVVPQVTSPSLGGVCLFDGHCPRSVFLK